jgi:hypothetical protein
MHEFHRDVLCVRGIRTPPESEQSAAAQESFGHLAAGFRECASFPREEGLEQLIARKQSQFDLRR